MKRAIITGITGQDGSYLAEFLLKKGYKVFGIVRRSACENTQRINHLLNNDNLRIHYGCITDYNRISEIIKEVNPHEIYNLAAQSHVGISFDLPEETFQVNSGGVLNILNIIKKQNREIRFYQASTSELYGMAPEVPQNEDDKFYPRSPYACAKLFSYWITVNYREAYNIFACNGILFNHESPRRGEQFVTRKITKAIHNIKAGTQDKLHLGNIYSKRDWGYAKEYIEAMWAILNQDEPDDYVIATGETHTIKDFVNEAFSCAGFNLVWEGQGCNERAVDEETGKTLVKIDERLYRPSENNILIGDYSKAEKILGWKPHTKFKELVKIMVNAEGIN